MATYLKPNIQLFAAPASEDDDPKGKDLQNNSAASTENNSTVVEDDLPKTQAELDDLIEKRLKREQKRWTKQQTTPSKASPATPPVEQPPAAPSTQPTAPAIPDNTELQEAQRDLMQTRAELAAYKSGVKPEAVEDAVLLAMHSVEKNGGDLDDDSIADALKEVLKRHAEWKAEDKGKQNPSGFRVGAGANENPVSEDEKLSSVFGNVKK